MFLSPMSILVLLCFFFLHHPIFNLADNFPIPFSPVDNIAINCGCFDNKLASPIPVSRPHDSRSWTPMLRKLVKVFGRGNAIATGVIVVITLINIVVYYLRRLSEANYGDKNLPSSSSEQLCRCFSLAEIHSATQNFDDAFVIGKGGFGKVYKGLIDGGASTVAVKRLDRNSKQGAHEFWTEIEMLSKFRHIHLVSLIGYCHDGHEMILVYEYMPLGTLSDHLHKLGRNGNSPLSWEQRLKICIGAARGLDYLRSGIGAQHRVIHRDVKSSNILLDGNWVAKISDFGLSKIGPANLSRTHVSTNVKGTFGYLDPDYFHTRRLTRKSDVYAFGVVLFEVLCGRPAVDSRLDYEQLSLVPWAKHCIEEGTIDQIIDPILRGQISPHCLKTFVEVAEKCLHNLPNKRPTMVDVVASLEFALSSQDQSTDSLTGEEEVINFGGAHDNQGNVDSSTEHEEIINVGNGRDHDMQIDRTTPLPNTGGIKKKVLKGIALVKSWGFRQDLPQKTKSLPFPDVNCLRFSFTEIKVATNNFHRDLIIADDDYSTTYKCYIDGGDKAVAIRLLKLEGANGASGILRNEITILSRIHHLHVVSLIGYCYDKRATVLVYDYMVRGTLHDHLYNTNYHPLLWKQRLQICIDTARGLDYLHARATPTIIHGDLKSTSILLDENWVAKVSDFGCSRLGAAYSDTYIPTFINCIYGYLDPEYVLSGRLTTKSDVYSLGVVLLEVLCRRQPCLNGYVGGVIYLPHWVKTNIEEKTLHQIIDPHLMGKIGPECLSEFIKTALCCLLDRARERPSMSDVVERLVFALQLQENAGGGIFYLDWENICSEIQSSSVGDMLLPVRDNGCTMNTGCVLNSSIASFDFDSMLFCR